MTTVQIITSLSELKKPARMFDTPDEAEYLSRATCQPAYHFPASGMYFVQVPPVEEEEKPDDQDATKERKGFSYAKTDGG